MKWCLEMVWRLVAVAMAMLLAAARARAQAPLTSCQPPAPADRLKLYGPFNYTRKIRTTSPEAQALFDQGMMLAFDYNQAEARAAFRAALYYDPFCAMCWWGLAYSRAPFQNKPAVPPPLPVAMDAVLPRYRLKDLLAARRAATTAAQLVGLLPPSGSSIADSGSSKAVGPRAADQPRLMQKLTHCPPSYDSSEGGGSKGAGAGRRALGLPSRRLQQAAAEQDQGPGPQQRLGPLGLPARRLLKPWLISGHNATAPQPAAKTPAKSPAPTPTASTGPGAAAASAGGAGDYPDAASFPFGNPYGASAGSGAELLALERHYIAAMVDRVSERSGATWGPAWAAVERRFAQDMADIAGCWLEDADAAALAAEAAANLSPWDFFDPATGAPRDITPWVLQLLAEAQARSGRSAHPLAVHLHIHVTEGLPAGRGEKHAGVAEASADALWGLRLSAFDHLTHMPSHTYVRVGRWADAVQSNVASLAASAAASAACLPSMYPDHDAAMGVFAASMAADLQVADTYSRVLKDLPRFIWDAPASVGGQWGAPLLVWVRFAQWRQVLAAEPPPAFVFQPPLTGLGAGNVTAAAGEGGGSSNSNSSGGSSSSSGGMDATAAAVAADVAADPHLHPALRAAAAAGRGPLKGTDYTPDGVEYARVLWHFSRVMALAAQIAAAEVQQAAANGTAAGGGAAGTTATAPKGPMTAAQLAAAAAAGHKSATDLAAEAATVQDEQDYRQKQAAPAAGGSSSSGGGGGSGGSSSAELEGRRKALAAEWAALRAANSLVPYDVPYPPGQGLGIVVPGWRLLANTLGRIAEARLAVLTGDLAVAAAALGQAAVVEASGGYYEPPRLGPQPARQCLGWVLLRAGRLREALQAYLVDLSQYPDNPWSVRGLHQALPAAQQQLEHAAARRDAARADRDAAAARGDKAAEQAAEAEAAGLDAEVAAATPVVAAARVAAEGASPATLTTATMLRSSCLGFSEVARL